MSNHEETLFTLEEYHQRIAITRSYMRAKNIELLIVDQTEFLFYLTGFGISENMYRACLLTLHDQPVMIFRAMDEHTFEQNSWLSDTVTFDDCQDPIDVVMDTIVQRGWDRLNIGVDFDSYCMTVKRFNRLQRCFPQRPLQDFSGVLEQLRECKSQRELHFISKAAQAADIALSAAVAGLKAGKAERDAATIVHQVFMANGMDSHRYGIITTGIGNSFLHGNLHNHPLTEGDIVHMELLPIFHGYSARLMRPVIIGNASQRQREIAEQLITIQDAQFAAMRPGAAAKEVDAIARDAVLAAGLRDDYAGITGYNLGYYPISTPHTSDFSRVFLPTAQWRLKPGMVFHMYIYAQGLAFSETIAITEQGNKRLTQTPRQLFVSD